MIVKSLGKFGRSVVASAAVSVFMFPAQAALSPSGDTSGATDQAAIADAVASGGTVELDEGTFYVNAEIAISSAVTVRGAGRDKTTVRQTVDKKKSNMIQRVFHLNHASGLLSRYILGAYPTAPGWAAYEVKPVAPASVTFAEGDVPTPRGLLHVSWKRAADGSITPKATFVR